MDWESGGYRSTHGTIRRSDASRCLPVLRLPHCLRAGTHGSHTSCHKKTGRCSRRMGFPTWTLSLPSCPCGKPQGTDDRIMSKGATRPPGPSQPPGSGESRLLVTEMLANSHADSCKSRCPQVLSARGLPMQAKPIQDRRAAFLC